jgi:glycosyltransferase involved in cell wall biosynthesis
LGAVESLNISVVIPAKDAEDTIAECLAALNDQSLEPEQYEVIVVDDGSSDRTASIARSYGAQTICQPNRGPANARNQGARAARGQILVFTDADCRPAHDFLEKLNEALADPGVAGAKGAYRSNQTEIVARFVQQEFSFKHERMARRDTIDAVHTYAAAFRKGIFARNDGFDETFRVPGNEDQEFSYRLAEQGHRLVFVPHAIVFHRHDRTLWEYGIRKLNMAYWKAYTLIHHPAHLAGDSHTPFAQLAQIALVGPTVACGLLAFWEPTAGWGALLLAGLFFGSAWPFAAYLYGHEKNLLVIMPLMIVIRAVAQALGLATGFFRWLVFR